MARLPQPGSDDGNWGDILNEFLSQSLKSDGTLKNNSVTSGTIASGAVSKSDVGLGNADNTSDANKPISTAVQTVLSSKESTANKGQANGYAELDGTGKVPSAQLPSQANAVTSVNTHTGVVVLNKGDIGLGNADNTSDASKPVSGATQTALDLKANLASPTFTGTVAGITKTMVGLGSVDNTSDASKPVSSAQATAIGTKEPLITAGTNTQYFRGDKSFQTLTQDVVPDGTTNKAYSATDKTKLSGIETGAQVNVNADWNAVSGNAQILNKPTIPAQAIQRQIVSTSGAVTAGASPNTDYVYIITGAHTVTLPTAVGNTNLYTIKNSHTANVTLAFTSSQNADGGGVILGPNEAIDLISNNTNWRII